MALVCLKENKKVLCWSTVNKKENEKHQMIQGLSCGQVFRFTVNIMENYWLAPTGREAQIDL